MADTLLSLTTKEASRLMIEPIYRISVRALISAPSLFTRAGEFWRIMVLMTLAYLGRFLASSYAWIRYGPTQLQQLSIVRQRLRNGGCFNYPYLNFIPRVAPSLAKPFSHAILPQTFYTFYKQQAEFNRSRLRLYQGGRL